MPRPSNLSVEPKTGPPVARCFVSHKAMPSAWRLPLPWILNSNSICVRATIRDHHFLKALGTRKHTSQFVAVNGTFENIHPLWDGRSEASRMYLRGCGQRMAQIASRGTGAYLSALIIVSPPKSNHRLCISVSRYGCSRGLVRHFLISCNVLSGSIESFKLETDRCETMCP